MLAGQVGSAELRDGVIAKLGEDTLIELLGALNAHRRVVIGDRLNPQVGLAHELIEEQSAHGLWRPAVPGEQCAFDDFRKVNEREDGPLYVCEETTEDGFFIVRERLFEIDAAYPLRQDSILG